MRLLNIITLLSAFLLFSCQSGKVDKTINQISVSILPQKYFIERVAGDDFKVNVLIPPGASPATYEPIPSQMKGIANSLVYFKIGHIPFEYAWLDNLLEGAGNIQLIDISTGIELVRGPEVRHGDHFHKGGIDPHIWSSPKSVKIILQNIYAQLVKLKPENKAKYEANYKSFLSEIDELDKMAAELKVKAGNKAFMIFHPALSYLARDYGLEQISIETDGKDPSPVQMKNLITNAEEKDIEVIFIQKQFNMDNARAIAKEIGARVEQIDPLNEDWAKEMNRIIKLLKAN